MREARALLLLFAFACKKELKQAECPEATANVDGICRATCNEESDCLLTEICLNQVCLPRSQNVGP